MLHMYTKTKVTSANYDLLTGPFLRIIYESGIHSIIRLRYFCDHDQERTNIRNILLRSRLFWRSEYIRQNLDGHSYHEQYLFYL